MKLRSLILASIALFSVGVKAEVTQADVNLDLGRFVGYWVYPECEKGNIKGQQCWFVIEKRKELYGDKEYFSYGMQRAIPAKAEVLKDVCGDFKYTTGFTVSNLPNNAICIKLKDGGSKAELYYPEGYTNHGIYEIKKSSEAEFTKRTENEINDRFKRSGR